MLSNDHFVNVYYQARHYTINETGNETGNAQPMKNVNKELFRELKALTFGFQICPSRTTLCIGKDIFENKRLKL